MSAPHATAFTVGLTGGIGSGKSLVADMFAERGATVIDTDAIAHAMTAPHGPAMHRIEAEFGAAFVAADGSMDRARMRELVFSDPQARHRLEAILHPMIREAANAAAVLAQGPYTIFAVPLLVEAGGWRARVSRVLVVDCAEALQADRPRRLGQRGLPHACRGSTRRRTLWRSSPAALTSTGNCPGFQTKLGSSAYQ